MPPQAGGFEAGSIFVALRGEAAELLAVFNGVKAAAAQFAADMEAVGGVTAAAARTFSDSIQAIDAKAQGLKKLAQDSFEGFGAGARKGVQGFKDVGDGAELSLNGFRRFSMGILHVQGLLLAFGGVASGTFQKAGQAVQGLIGSFHVLAFAVSAGLGPVGIFALIAGTLTTALIALGAPTEKEKKRLDALTGAIDKASESGRELIARLREARDVMRVRISFAALTGADETNLRLEEAQQRLDALQSSVPKLEAELIKAKRSQEEARKIPGDAGTSAYERAAIAVEGLNDQLAVIPRQIRGAAQEVAGFKAQLEAAKPVKDFQDDLKKLSVEANRSAAGLKFGLVDPLTAAQEKLKALTELSGLMARLASQVGEDKVFELFRSLGVNVQWTNEELAKAKAEVAKLTEEQKAANEATEKEAAARKAALPALQAITVELQKQIDAKEHAGPFEQIELQLAEKRREIEKQVAVGAEAVAAKAAALAKVEEARGVLMGAATDELVKQIGLMRDQVSATGEEKTQVAAVLALREKINEAIRGVPSDEQWRVQAELDLLEQRAQGVDDAARRQKTLGIIDGLVKEIDSRRDALAVQNEQFTRADEVLALQKKVTAELDRQAATDDDRAEVAAHFAGLLKQARSADFQAEFSRPFAASLGESIRSAILEGKSAMESLAEFGDRLFNDFLDKQIAHLEDNLSRALTGIFGAAGQGLGEVMSGIAGVAGLLFSRANGSSSQAFRDLSEITSTEAVRGIVAGPGSIAIAAVGEDLRRANSGVEVRLDSIIGILLQIRNGGSGLYGKGDVGFAGTTPATI